MSGHDIRPDPAAIEAFARAVMANGATHEARMLGHWQIGVNGKPFRRVWAGCFDDPAALAAAVARYGPDAASGAYITLNAVRRKEAHGAPNRIGESRVGVRDEQIDWRSALLIDVDPVRVGVDSKDSATDGERAAALALRGEVRAYLTGRGWPDPVAETESGNGGGLVYRIDLPADDEATALVKGVLVALADRFNTDAATIDVKNENASRITKLPGTVAAKGPGTPERPWRLATAVLVPDAEHVTPAQLREVANERAQRTSGGRDRPPLYATDGELLRVDIPALLAILDGKGIAHRHKARADCDVYDLSGGCPFTTDHDSGAYVVAFHESGGLRPGNALVACHHDRCDGKGWTEAAAHLGIVVPVLAGIPASWEAPIPLDSGSRPPWPNGALPGVAGEMVAAVSEATQTPRALAAVFALGVLSTALAKRVEVQPWEGWREPVNLYALVALPSGNRKTAAEQEMTRPVVAWEAEQASAMAAEVEVARSRRDIEEQRLGALKKAASRATDRTESLRLRGDVEALTRALLEDPDLIVPTPPRLLVEDVTPEKLLDLMADQGGRMACISAEGGLLDIIAGRFSKDGKTPLLDPFLKAHAGENVLVDRIGRAAQAVPKAALTIALSVQPEVIEGMAARPGFRGRGLLARFLYAVPASTVGQRAIRPGPVPASVAAGWDRLIRALLDLPKAPAGAWTLTFSPAGERLMIDFAGTVEPRLGEDGDLGHAANWGNKLAGLVARLAGLVARLAGLFHAAACVEAGRRPWEDPIPAETVKRTIRLAEAFLIPHALTALSMMGADPNVGAAQHVGRLLARWPEPTISRRDIHQALRAAFPSPSDLDPAIRLLVEHEWLAPIEVKVEVGKPGRRPSPLFAINPAVKPRNPHIPHNPDRQHRNAGFEECADYEQRAHAEPSDDGDGWEWADDGGRAA